MTVCKPCPHFTGYYNGFQYSDVTCPICRYEARIRELETELAECRISRQREHDLRVTIAGELESFKIRYQDEVNARLADRGCT